MEKIQIKLVHTILPLQDQENLTVPGCNSPGSNNNNVLMSKNSNAIHFRDENEQMTLDTIEEMGDSTRCNGHSHMTDLLLVV